MEDNVNFAKINGYSKTLYNRIKKIEQINSSRHHEKQAAERFAMNMPLQGSASDIIKLAMIKINNTFKEQNLKSLLVLQIHDELIVDTFIDEKEKVEKILVEEMEGAVKLSVPLTVGLGSGKTWFDAK